MPDWLASLLRAEMPLFFVVLLRLVIGGEFIYQGYTKYNQGYLDTIMKDEEVLYKPLQLKLDEWKSEPNAIAWYQKFLEIAVEDNMDIFAILVTVGEFAVGALLVLGLLVRIVSVVGFVMCLNYLFATWHLGFPFREFNIVVLALMAVFLLVGAGRCLGADAVLHDRFPEIPLF